ncbi:MAG: DNA-binding protein WhiA [Clostridiales bacterium]|nr:DNA-binding protein WhiA [Clostridiales bacterium]
MNRTDDNSSRSFSSGIKKEISSIAPRSLSDRQAVIAGVFCTATSDGDDSPAHRVRLTGSAAEYIVGLLKREKINATSEKIPGSRSEYQIDLPDIALDEFDRMYGVCFTEAGKQVLAADTSFTRSFLRGAFLACGYCSDPHKTYRIELHIHNKGIVESMTDMLIGQDIHPSQVIRDSATVLYISNGDSVSDFLSMIGATASMLAFENIRAEHELLGSVVRTVNCDSGNTKRQAEAGARRTELIRKLMQSPKASQLPESLAEAARVHLENPGASIAELGKMMDPPIGKSGMNHRLEKLLQIANSID